MVRSERDEAILETLALKVRMLSLEQIARTWWSDTKSPATFAFRRLDQLTRAKLLEHCEVLTEPLLDLAGPVFAWAPGDPAPDADATAYALQSRWKDPPVRTSIFAATTKTKNQYGGRGHGGIRLRQQVNHDLHHAQIYLRFLQTDPDAATAWIGEDLLGKAGHGVKDPDAVLEYRNGRPPVAIEFGGRYDARRVRDFHQHCTQHQVRYELW